MKKLQRVLFCITAIGVLGAGSAAIAAPDESGGGQADENGVPNGLQEVVVTAQRRTELLENVPMSVSVITPQSVQNSDITNFMQLGQITTGAQMNFSGSVPGIAVRGVSSSVAGYNIEPNVAVYTDGFYDPQPVTMASDIANLESIEVLKGPQGTLYGRNATGGAVLVNTLGPSKTFTGQFDASYGSFRDRIFNGYVAGPINDGARYSLSGHYQAGDSSTQLISPTVIGETIGAAVQYVDSAARGKLQLDLTDKLQATIGLHYGYLNDPRENMYSVSGHIEEPFAPPPLRPTQLGTEAYAGGPIPQYAHTYEGTLKLVYNSPIGTLTSSTGYANRYFGLDFNFDGTYVGLVYFKVKYDQQTFQQSLDYDITAIDKLDLLVGASYYNDRIYTPDPNTGLEIFQLGTFVDNSSTEQKTDSAAAYVDATYHLTDQLYLDAGGRFTRDHRYDNYQTVGPGGVFFQPFVSGEHSWTAFTPRANIRYELAPRTDAYVSWSQGYRSAGYNPSGPVANTLIPANPERITAYEVGFKTAWSKIQFDSALFYYDYSQLLVVTVVPNPINPALGTVSSLENAPKATIYGWDNELNATPTDYLTVHAGLELLRGRFGSFPNAAGTGVDPTNTFNIGGQTQNWSDLQLPRAPYYSGNVGFYYKYPLSYGSLMFTTNLNFTDSYVVSNPSTYGPVAPASLQNVQRFRDNAYQLLSAELSWTNPSGHFTVTVYGNNLTNTSYRLTYDAGPFGDFSILSDLINGGGRVAYKF